jgi:branched-chain amino acid transport system permease protein
MAVVLVLALFGLEVGFEILVPDAAWRQLALFAMVNVIVALSLNIINGSAPKTSSFRTHFSSSRRRSSRPG